MARIFLFLAIIIATSTAVKQANAGDISFGTLIIENPWSRATPKSARVGAGYLNILNIGDTEDRLISAQSDISERVQIHTMNIEDGVMKMREIDDGLAIGPKSEVILKPGGYHLMFISLKAPLKEGEDFDVVLNFKNAGKISVLFKTGRIGGISPYPQKPSLHSGSASGSSSGSHSN